MVDNGDNPLGGLLASSLRGLYPLPSRNPKEIPPIPLKLRAHPQRAKTLLSKRRPDEPDNALTDGAAVLEELIALGVLSRRKDGPIDVPDIYRYGFGIKRKGGVARPR